MLEVLKQVRQKAVIGFVGGSDLAKITEQLAIHGQDSASRVARPCRPLARPSLTPCHARHQSRATSTTASPRTA